mmetsp:Transcript_28355/g.43724  ORF Transcript_28355/g.43724 Transcript_28355/m.43724 type:complete len:201 (+) Transcript_28355:356-958(+)
MQRPHGTVREEPERTQSKWEAATPPHLKNFHREVVPVLGKLRFTTGATLAPVKSLRRRPRRGGACRFRGGGPTRSVFFFRSGGTAASKHSLTAGVALSPGRLNWILLNSARRFGRSRDAASRVETVCRTAVPLKREGRYATATTSIRRLIRRRIRRRIGRRRGGEVSATVAAGGVAIAAIRRWIMSCLELEGNSSRSFQF